MRRLVLLLALATPALPQAPPPDATILRQAYTLLHPGLYRYNTSIGIDEDLNFLAAELANSTTTAQSYLALSQFTAKIKCGHTYPNFFNQNKAVTAEVIEAGPRVPFYFLWLDKRTNVLEKEMVVTEDFTPNHALRAGTRILDIDGHTSADILAKLMTIARADGSNDAKRIAQLAVTGEEQYGAFDVYYPLFFSSTAKTIKLRIQRPYQPIATLIVQPQTHADRVAQWKAHHPSSNSSALFEWKRLPHNVAYLRMPTWAVYNSKWDWQTWLNQHLDEAADTNAAALIVDLRENEGGNDVGDLILQRYVDHDLTLTGTHRLVRYRKVPDNLAPYLDTWDPSFKDWGKAAVDLPKPLPTAPPVTYYDLIRSSDKGSNILKPASKRLHARLFILTSATNSSATFNFAQTVQQNHLGTLVGAPTGGNQRGINGGAFFFLRLPNSHIEVDLPLIATFPETPQPDQGLTPDRIVHTSADDIANHRDPEMETVTQLLQF